MTCYVWLLAANEQLDMTLSAKILRLEDDDNHAFVGKLYLPLLSAQILLFTTGQETQCGRCEAIIFN